MDELECASCGKSMLDSDGDSMAAYVISPFYAKDPDCAREQMGEYYNGEAVYTIYFECLLKSLGVKKPE
jgi:hypothetical protein